MNKISLGAIFAALISAMPLALAGHHEASMHHDHATTFNYAEINQLGEPATVIEVKEGTSRPLEIGEIRVKVLAAPIHPSNLLAISGNYLTTPVLPSIPGSEGVGQVVELSSEVTHLTKGQLVLLAGMGTWSEEIVAPAAMVIPLPDLGKPSAELIEQLSMSTINPLTALLMLNSYVDLKEGDWIVQSASNSAVGGYLIQLAKQRGIKTVNVVRREGLAEDLMAKGADAVLIDGPDLAQQIASATNNAPVVLAIDAVGGDTFSRLAESLGNGGTLVTYGVLSGKFPTLNLGTVLRNDIRVQSFWLTRWFGAATMADRQAAFGQIIPLIASGALKANIDSRFSVTQIKEAATRAGQRGRNGKVLIVPHAH